MNDIVDVAAPPELQIRPAQLGAPSFLKRYAVRYAYVAGSMYKAIASKEMVCAMANAGLLGFLGTGGRRLEEMRSDIQFIQTHITNGCGFGVNLLCDINRPERVMAAVELFLAMNITCVEAAAFVNMTEALVYYRVKGLYRNRHGGVECRHRIIGKISRPEVAVEFMSPPPRKIVEKLLADGKITEQQWVMSQQVPVADDLCVEADSGGHTDQGAASVLLPAIQLLREQVVSQHDYLEPLHIGLAGGIGTPQAVLSAFMLGADFVLTGSINQCTVEAGTSDLVKDMLQEMNIQDTDYVPAGDMFEIGAKAQVLKKGVFFPQRANKLYQLYTYNDAWEQIPLATREQIESRFFQRTFADIWAEVEAYHRAKGNHKTLEKAEKIPKHKMALVFRWYFSYTTRLAIAGDAAHKIDFQIQSGPALGAFNQWVKGTSLENWRNRHVAVIAEKLMQDCAALINKRFTDFRSMSSFLSAVE